MGLFAQRLSERKGIGYPNVGWQPPFGWFRTSSTGITVTEDNANTVAAWYAGIRVIAQDVSTLPLIVYRQQGRDKVRARDHRMYRLLHDAPNPEMTSVVFRETLQAHMLAWGNGYAEKELDRADRTIGLWPLRPDRMTVSYDENGKRVYDYVVKPGAAPTRLEAKRVFHLPGMGFDGLVGYPLLTLARETLANILSLREYGGRVIERDARPGVILSHPETLSDTAKKNLEASWNDKHGGFTNAGRTAILEEGMTVTTLNLPREDILFLESQKWNVAEVARWLRVAPHKIGDLERATFSNIEEQNIDHVSSTLRPWCTRWEQQIDKDLLPEPDLFAEHLMDDALRGKTLERYQAFAIATQNKAMVPNEWRAFENWNPVPWGDEPVLTPNNEAPPVAPEPQGEDEEPPEDDEAKAQTVIVNVAGTTVYPPDIKSPDVIVNMAETPAPVVNVAPAEVRIDAPVTVNMPEPPEPRKTRRSVNRDDKGRITSVTEESV
jgi:HK97 family phage portal protein